MSYLINSVINYFNPSTQKEPTNLGKLITGDYLLDDYTTFELIKYCVLPLICNLNKSSREFIEKVSPWILSRIKIHDIQGKFKNLIPSELTQ